MGLVAGVDLNWGVRARRRIALALVNEARHVRLSTALTEEELLSLLADARPGLVALDIPIDGCQDLSHQNPWRPVDRALAGAGVPLLPSYKAGTRGLALRARIQAVLGDQLPVWEVYPYSAYKVLAYLMEKGNGSLAWDIEAEGFRRWWPPKYKRGKTRQERLAALAYLHGLLTHPALGLTFDPPLPSPIQAPRLNVLADGYDACLAAIPGVYWQDGNPSACLAGDADHGKLLLLAHPWLQRELKRRVPVTNA